MDEYGFVWLSSPYDTRVLMWPKYSDICLTVEEKPGKTAKQEIDPTGDWTRTRCVRGNDVTLDHGGDLLSTLVQKTNAFHTYSMYIINKSDEMK